MIEQYIPKGEPNAITRAELAQLSGLPDRTVRREIADARKRGVCICNFQNGRGYYRPTTYEEAYRFHKQETKRLAEISRADKAAVRFMLEFGQIGMGDVIGT
jgi:predicted HTH transcriptional regulator